MCGADADAWHHPQIALWRIRNVARRSNMRLHGFDALGLGPFVRSPVRASRAPVHLSHDAPRCRCESLDTLCLPG